MQPIVAIEWHGTGKSQNELSVSSLARSSLIVAKLRSRPQLTLILAKILNKEWADVCI